MAVVVVGVGWLRGNDKLLWKFSWDFTSSSSRHVLKLSYIHFEITNKIHGVKNQRVGRNKLKQS